MYVNWLSVCKELLLYHSLNVCMNMCRSVCLIFCQYVCLVGGEGRTGYNSWLWKRFSQGQSELAAVSAEEALAEINVIVICKLKFVDVF